MECLGSSGFPMLPFSFHGAQQGFEREPAADEQEEKPDFRRASGGGAGREGVGVGAGASPVKSRLRHHLETKGDSGRNRSPLFNWKKAQMEVLWKSGMKAVRNDCVPGDWAIKSLQLPGDSGHGAALRYGWTDRSLGAGRWSIPGNTWFIIMRSTGNGD